MSDAVKPIGEVTAVKGSIGDLTVITWRGERPPIGTLLYAAPPAPISLLVGVKPLEWEEDLGFRRAQTNIIACYSIWDTGDHWECSLLDGQFKTVDDAKAAAQRDWDARILAAIAPQSGTPAPAPAEPEQLRVTGFRGNPLRVVLSSGDEATIGQRLIDNFASPSPFQQHPDDVAVDRFAAAMKAKLAQKRDEGRSGWDDKDDCSQLYLSQLLREHVEKGDPLDVGNFAMMLHQREERIASLLETLEGE